MSSSSNSTSTSIPTDTTSLPQPTSSCGDGIPSLPTTVSSPACAIANTPYTPGALRQCCSSDTPIQNAKAGNVHLNIATGMYGSVITANNGSVAGEVADCFVYCVPGGETLRDLQTCWAAYFGEVRKETPGEWNYTEGILCNGDMDKVVPSGNTAKSNAAGSSIGLKSMFAVGVTVAVLVIGL